MMMRWMAALLAVLTLAGCSTPVVVSEVLQQPKGADIYTRYNLWYTNPVGVSSLNIQQGRFIPIGTKIEPLEANQQKFRFRTADGGEFTLLFDAGMRMCSMQDFLRGYLTLEKPEAMFAKFSEAARPFIKRGEVVPGMDRQEVLAAYGPPPASRTPSLKNETWIYWIAPTRTIRVVFRNDKVRNIINTNE